MSLRSGARAITISTVTFSRPMIRSILSPLNTPGSAAVEAEQRKKPDCLVEVLDDKADVDEVGDAGAIAVHTTAHPAAGSSTHRAKSAGPTLLPQRIEVTRRPANRSDSMTRAATPSA